MTAEATPVHAGGAPAGLGRTHPLGDGLRADLPRLTAGAVTVPDPVTACGIRLDAPGPAADALAEVVGVALPLRPCTWVATATGRVVWLGPDEWLVQDAAAAPWDLEERLRAVAVPLGAAAVDVSDQRVALRVQGPCTRDLLAAGCALDTHPSVLGAGSAAQTLLGQAGVVLLVLADDGEDVEVLVRSSFARYLAAWFADAAVELRGADA